MQKRDCLYGSVITRYKNRKPRFYLKTGPETEPIFKNRNRHTTIYVYVYDHHWWNYNKICMGTDCQCILFHTIGMVPILNIFKWEWDMLNYTPVQMHLHSGPNPVPNYMPLHQLQMY